MPMAKSTASEPVGMAAISSPSLLAEAHDRALAELAIDLGHGGFDGLEPVGFRSLA